jgi:hypothetical protein
MNTLLHSAAQGFGWLLGAFYGSVLAFLSLALIKKLTTNPMGKLSLREQHKLFRAYYAKLEQKQRYEELAALDPVLATYARGEQPTRKQLKPFKVVKHTKFNAGSMKFSTKHRIEAA